MNNLAVFLFEGRGVSKDVSAAKALIEKAANSGQLLAQYILGRRLVRGDGIPKDLIEGCAWLMLANSRGYENAGKLLELVLGEIDQSDVRQAKSKMMKRLHSGCDGRSSRDQNRR